jgi:hypothetical protein
VCKNCGCLDLDEGRAEEILTTLRMPALCLREGLGLRENVWRWLGHAT